MKADKHFSYVLVCPKTREKLTKSQYAYSGGVCPHCGHNDHSTFTHSRKIVGRWRRPSFWEWLCGRQPEFIEVNITE